jgi:hypothetical protein
MVNETLFGEIEESKDELMENSQPEVLSLSEKEEVIS